MRNQVADGVWVRQSERVWAMPSWCAGRCATVSGANARRRLGGVLALRRRWAWDARQGTSQNHTDKIDQTISELLPSEAAYYYLGESRRSRVVRHFSRWPAGSVRSRSLPGWTSGGRLRLRRRDAHQTDVALERPQRSLRTS